MIELLILFFLDKNISTMYGLQKKIKTEFSTLLLPSIGTIKPALKRLEVSGFLTTQKVMSKGGRPSVYYAISQPGRMALKELMLKPFTENPVQFLTNARIRLYCSNVLSQSEILELIDMLKQRTEGLVIETSKFVGKDDENFYHRLVYNNLNCEYKNFLQMLEGIERACKH